MKFKRSVVIPSLLAVYLSVMAIIGYPDFKAGATSPKEYFGTIAVTLIVIVLLHFNIRHRDRLKHRHHCVPEGSTTLENTPPTNTTGL
ncbi:MAG: hypothetical protein K2L80_09440 [Muribaculaceae bacterium]|nr:hypothetical protein [Muribaculaceae bacterium]